MIGIGLDAATRFYRGKSFSPQRSPRKPAKIAKRISALAPFASSSLRTLRLKGFGFSREASARIGRQVSVQNRQKRDRACCLGTPILQEMICYRFCLRSDFSSCLLSLLLS